MTAAVKLALGGAGILLIPILLAAAGAGMLASLAGGGNTGTTITCVPDGATATAAAGYSSEQMSNAATIVAVGKQLNVPAYGWVIAVAAAMQESGLRNLNHGDRDSLGLFQQRPSQGWGSAQQVLTPAYAATLFYQHLLAVPNWQQMALTEAAQAVQISGAPGAYARQEQAARQIVGALSGVACANPARAPGQPRTDWPPEPATEPDPTSNGRITPRTLTLVHTLHASGMTGAGLACAASRPANPDSDHPHGRACDIMLNANNQQSVADGWRIANWLATQQAQLGVHYLIWQGQYWSAEEPVWAPYRSDAYGCPNPANLTGCHYDHIHISIF